MSSFFEYERATNVFISVIQETPQFREIVKFHCTKYGAAILAPQSVTLEGVNLTKSFLESHVIIPNPSNTSQFVTLNGVHGVFSDTREILRVVCGPPADQTVFNPLLDPTAVFAKNPNVYVGFDPKTAIPIHVLREGDLTLQLSEEEALLTENETPKSHIVVQLILISDPLVFPGCEWGHKARTLSPVKELKPLRSPTLTLAPSVSAPVAPTTRAGGAGSMMGSLIPSMPSIPMPALYIPYLGGGSNNSTPNTGTPTPGSPTKNTDRTAVKGGLRDSLWSLFGSVPASADSSATKPPLFPDSLVTPQNTHAYAQQPHLQPQQLLPRTQQQQVPLTPIGGSSTSASQILPVPPILTPTTTSTSSVTANDKVLEPLVRPLSTTSSDTAADSENRKRSDFFTKLKHHKAADLSKALKNFVAQMRARAGDTSLEDEAQIVRIFINDMEADVLAHSLWNREVSEEELDSIREGLEKCITCKTRFWFY